MAVAPGDADYKGDAVKSPTTLVMEYLAKNKMSPNMPGYSAAVRDALAANAKDPTLIPGLRADRASTEEEDQAAMKAAGPSVGRRGNVSTQIESVESPQGGTPDKSPDRSPAPGTTSAPPADDGSLSPDYYLGATGNGSPSGLAALILGGGAAGGAGAYGLSKLRNWGLGSGAGPMPDPGAAVAPPAPTAMAEPPVSPMTQAMNKAIEPATGVPSVGDSVPPMPDIGPVPQPRIPAGPSSAVLPADLGSPPPQTIPSGPNTQVRPANMPENAPRVPMPNRVGAAPTPADFYHPSWRTLGPLARSILGHI